VGGTYNYRYDSIGQLTNANSSADAEDRNYKYDAAWNLTVRTNGADLDTLYVDARNQLTNAYLNSGHGNYDFTYDSNGNLTVMSIDYFGASEGYFYDDENRLNFATHTESGPPINWWDPPQTASDRVTEFRYDGLGRLRERLEYVVEGDYGSYSWVLASHILYIYDGWRVIQERDGDDTPTVSYTRGTDLSGTLEGAGGIGGLLARSHGYSGGNWSTHNYYHADGNGNITYLVTSAQGLAASYRYDPYGNALTWSGSLADENVYGFSSKEFHVQTGLYYYGYRFYSPSLQRWLNRDPISEKGFFQISHPSLEKERQRAKDFDFVKNSPLVTFDPLGLWQVCCRNVRAEPGDGPVVIIASKILVHCDLRNGPCDDPQDRSYPATRNCDGRCPHKMDNGKDCCKVTSAEINQCLKRNPYNSGTGKWGNNCQSNTRERLENCCLKSDWNPHVYAYPADSFPSTYEACGPGP
jgi:RHS repeat-associated protein